MSFADYQKTRGTRKPNKPRRNSSRGGSSFSRGGSNFSRGGNTRGRDSDNNRGRGNDSNRGFSRKKRVEPIRHDKEQFIDIKFPNTFLHLKRRGMDLFTINLNPGEVYFDESVIFKNINDKKTELRNWDYTRSKLGAAIALKISQLGIYEGSKVLYLGASHGFTPSFVSDMVGEKGFVFCLDFAPRVVRDLYLLSQKRGNMAPIIADANHPEEYEDLVSEVDVIFMDIAQRNQVEIFLKNFKFLKKDGVALLALKARSVDVTKKPKYVFKEAREMLEKEVLIVDYKELDPHEKDHCFFVCRKK